MVGKPKCDTLKGVAIQTLAAYAACKNLSLLRLASFVSHLALAWGILAFQKIGAGIVEETGFMEL
ncbi:MAG TPA: hypothetical protein DCY88_23685 [Cyanobacteria bacterium UBA11372]|nr:hypothetical protein [Cyanobacteria bacterium UBA11372]